MIQTSRATVLVSTLGSITYLFSTMLEMCMWEHALGCVQMETYQEHLGSQLPQKGVELLE